jgi:uncharacterized membrane protein
MPDNYHPVLIFDAVLLLAFVGTLIIQARKLPVQNVVSIVALMMVISVVIEVLNIKISAPFGPRIFTDRLGWVLFRLVPWQMPLLWVVIVLNSRVAAQFSLRPWRQKANYGWWMLGVTCAAATLLDAVLDPFASRVEHFWVWTTIGHIPGWYGAPWIHFIGWGATCLLMLGLTLPWLIDKKPGGSSPRGCRTPILYLTLTLLLALANASAQLWATATVGLATAAGISLLAWRDSSR